MYFFLVSLVFDMAIFLAASGQNPSPQYVIQHYTSANGLPQNSVLSIVFDKNGYCWLATEAGLVRFDNSEFKTYGTDDIPGLLDDRIHELKLDTSGNVFAKNVHDQTISTIPVNGLFSPMPHMVKGNDPNYYPDAGYLSFNPLIDTLWDSIVKRSSIPLLRTHYCLRNGDTYLVYTNYIYWLTHNRTWLLKKWPATPLTTAPVGSCLLQLWPGNNIAIWRHGILLTPTKLSGDILNDSSFFQYPQKLLWCPAGTFIYSNGDLYSISVTGNSVNTKKVLSGLPMKLLSCIYYIPESDTYYMGTFTDGLFIVKGSGFSTPVIPKVFGTQNFYAVGKTSKDLLIARNTFIPKDRPPYYLPLNNDEFFAYVDSIDRLYYQKGFELYRLDTRKHKNQFLINLDERLASILPNPGTHEILICTAKSLTCFSENDSALWKRELPIKYNMESVVRLFPLEKNKYILLTNNGVKWYDITSDKIYKSILDSIRFRSFYKDNSDRLWFGSDGSGAFMYQNNHIYKLPLGNLKQLKTIHSFIDDGRGFFWLPTNNGLFKVNITSLANYITHKTDDIYLYSLNSQDGLPTNEFNGGCSPAFQWLSDSTLVLPSMNGLVEFKPLQLKINYPYNKIFLDEINVDSGKIQLSSLNDAIKLKPDFNVLRIKVSCPYFGNPRNLQLEYAVYNGSNKYQWQAVPSNGQLSINTLAVGDYKIIIRKSGFYLDDKNATLIIKVSVLPYFYNTWWFYLSLLMLFAFTGYFLSRRRIAYLQKEKQKIEQIVSIRTSELNNIAQQLTKSESSLKQSNKVKEQVIAMVLHDLRSPVRFLKTISNNLVRNYEHEKKEKIFDSLKILSVSIGSLWGFIDQFFIWAVNQQENFKIKESTFLLQEIFDEVANFFSEILSFNKNKLEVRNTDIECSTDRDVLFLIIRNLVDNANKNTSQGLISISALKEESHIQILIKDTGIGMDENRIKMFMDASKGLNVQGSGSVIVLNTLPKIDGRLSIQSAFGKGSAFVITIPKIIKK